MWQMIAFDGVMMILIHFLPATVMFAPFVGSVVLVMTIKPECTFTRNAVEAASIQNGDIAHVGQHGAADINGVIQGSESTKTR